MFEPEDLYNVSLPPVDMDVVNAGKHDASASPLQQPPQQEQSQMFQQPPQQQQQPLQQEQSQMFQQPPQQPLQPMQQQQFQQIQQPPQHPLLARSGCNIATNTHALNTTQYAGFTNRNYVTTANKKPLVNGFTSAGQSTARHNKNGVENEENNGSSTLVHPSFNQSGGERRGEGTSRITTVPRQNQGEAISIYNIIYIILRLVVIFITMLKRKIC